MCQTCNSGLDEYNGDERQIISFVAISIYTLQNRFREGGGQAEL